MAAYNNLRNVFSSINSTQLNNFSHRINGQVCGYATGKIRNIEKKLGIPSRPKRPLSAYLQFCGAQRKSVVEQYPGLPATGVTKKLAELWKTSSPETKEEYKKKYVESAQAYSQEVIEYEKKLTPEQALSITGEKAKIKKTTENKAKKNEMIALGKPKRPPTAFILYMLSKKSEREKSGTKVSDWLGVIAKEWASAPPDVKIKFENESAKLMEQYKTETIEWETKMIHDGNISVVRKQSLINIRDKKKRSKNESTTAHSSGISVGEAMLILNAQPTPIVDNPTLRVADKTSSVDEKTSSVGETTSSVDEKTSSVGETTSSVGDTTSSSGKASSFFGGASSIFGGSSSSYGDSSSYGGSSSWGDSSSGCDGSSD
ncbi:hypothetical protein HCN44_008652 [Aphidius gifuensis]|uniref:HMG box domain-containing protein n=1 Tax=Aphidius gifuensis TaxID=684658 RepID=A0A834XP25_APHGI|nr:transcription factor A, mitochondrial-like [Aphidius gifuensis]KAF7989978.1 hypothetical protein HCN44_008652 [Aphidius gifuensis]